MNGFFFGGRAGVSTLEDLARSREVAEALISNCVEEPSHSLREGFLGSCALFPTGERTFAGQW